MNKVSTKKRIIEATLSFYDKLVFQRVSLSKIAHKAGITKPAIYRHFKSREELEKAVMETIGEDLVQYVDVNNREAQIRNAAFGGDPYALSLEVPIFDFCKKKRYFYYMISNTSTKFDLDSFFVFLMKKGVKSLETIFDKEGGVTDYVSYRKIVYLSGTFLFFQGSRDKTLLETGEDDTDEKIKDYAAKLSSFILWQGLEHDLSGITQERLGELSLICRRPFIQPRRVSDAEVFFHAVAEAVAQNGFVGVTLDDIAGKIGLAKSTLYERFASKKDLIRQLVLEECSTLFAIMIENLTFARVPAECVYILMASEFEYFMRDSDFMYVLRWLQMQNADDDIVNEEYYLKNETVRDFYALLLNADIFTQVYDFGSPKIDVKALFAWIFHMPLFVMSQAVKHGFGTENFHEVLTSLFYFMERGLYWEDKIGSTGEDKTQEDHNRTETFYRRKPEFAADAAPATTINEQQKETTDA